jgi:hypothetical protein
VSSLISRCPRHCIPLTLVAADYPAKVSAMLIAAISRSAFGLRYFIKSDAERFVS